jgi:hypothetical protein
MTKPNTNFDYGTYECLTEANYNLRFQTKSRIFENGHTFAIGN